MHKQFWLENHSTWRSKKQVEIYIMNLIVNIYDAKVWTGFSWLRITYNFMFCDKGYAQKQSTSV
jgi:hypothetical protein